MWKDGILTWLEFSEERRPTRDPRSNRSWCAGDHWSRFRAGAGILSTKVLAPSLGATASETIRELPGYRALLMVLLRSGGAKVRCLGPHLDSQLNWITCVGVVPALRFQTLQETGISATPYQVAIKKGAP